MRPTLEYCSAVWDPYTNTNIKKLEQINTKAATFITNNYSLAPGTTPLIKQQINMDSLDVCRQAHRLTLLYKISNEHIDIDKHEYLQNTNIFSTHNSHKKNIKHIMQIQTLTGILTSHGLSRNGIDYHNTQ